MKQEVQALKLVKRPQVLSQDVSISYDFLVQETQVFHAYEKRSLTRDTSYLYICRFLLGVPKPSKEEETNEQ